MYSEKSHEKTCWQYMRCSWDFRKDCPTYKTNMEEPCWIANKPKENIMNICKRCPWYEKKIDLKK